MDTKFIILLIVLAVTIAGIFLFASHKSHTKGRNSLFGLSSTGHATITCSSVCGAMPAPGTFHCDGGDSGIICNQQSDKWECTKCDASHEGKVELGCPCALVQGAPTPQTLCSASPEIKVCQDDGSYNTTIPDTCSEITENIQKYGGTTITDFCKTSLNCPNNSTPECTDGIPAQCPSGHVFNGPKDACVITPNLCDTKSWIWFSGAFVPMTVSSDASEPPCNFTASAPEIGGTIATGTIDKDGHVTKLIAADGSSRPQIGDQTAQGTYKFDARFGNFCTDKQYC